jgi:hypothetical protein
VLEVMVEHQQHQAVELSRTVLLLLVVVVVVVSSLEGRAAELKSLLCSSGRL